MIEFNGYLTGNAEKRYFKKSFEFTQYLCLFSLLIGVLYYPVLARLANRFAPMQVLMYLFYGMCVLSPVWLRIPQIGKRRIANTPKRIAIEDGFIACDTDKTVIGRELQDVKKVRDFGEFYELVFPWTKLNGTFICQKDLLTKGSLGEFEKLFEGKIVSMV